MGHFAPSRGLSTARRQCIQATREHGLKYQSVIGTDGLFYDFNGPFDGRRHDNFLLRESKLLERLDVIDPHSDYFLYGDGAYYISSHIIGPHLGAVLTPEQREFNLSMSQWGSH